MSQSKSNEVKCVKDRIKSEFAAFKEIRPPSLKNFSVVIVVIINHFLAFFATLSGLLHSELWLEASVAELATLQQLGQLRVVLDGLHDVRGSDAHLPVFLSLCTGKLKDLVH